ncbi:MAG: ferredoxin reductase family protein [Chlorobi bacterium]|nr:ferredoxin reductase family protein [Chlorobiota bacterium]
MSFALLGFTILSLQFILSARIKWFERPFGLDIILHFHRAMAIFAVFLLLIHPILLSAGSKGFSLLYELDVSPFIWIGRIVLILLLLIIFISMYRVTIQMDFQRWLRAHSTLAIIILLGGFIHSFFTGMDFEQFPMKIIWILLLAQALFFYVYHRNFRLRRLHRNFYRVVDVVQESHNVYTLKFQPSKGTEPLQYLPGQFHFITLHREEHQLVEEHPFTISSSPSQKDIISSTIKFSGDFTSTIHQTKPGHKVLIDGAYGRFSYTLFPEENKLVFIAGGIGITPFISMLLHMRDTHAKKEVRLIYSNRTQKDVVFLKELAELEKETFPNLKVTHILSKPDENWTGQTGKLNGERIKQLCESDFYSLSFYICGPPGMTDKLASELQHSGIHYSQIHLEKFSF